MQHVFLDFFNQSKETEAEWHCTSRRAAGIEIHSSLGWRLKNQAGNKTFSSYSVVDLTSPRKNPHFFPHTT